MKPTNTVLFVLRASTLLLITSVVKVDGQIHLSVGSRHACAFERMSGELKCWGYNGHFQLNNNTQTEQLTPINISLVSENTVAEGGQAGGHSTCMTSNDGGVVSCVGYNDYGHLGNGATAESVASPTVMSLSGNTIINIVMNLYHSCVINYQKALLCAGRNDHGQLGVNDNNDRYEPTPADGGHIVEEVSVGYVHTCLVDNTFKLLCMGQNLHGQLGIGNNSNKNTPTAVYLGDRTVKEISCGAHHTCFINDEASVYCMGRNQYGQLGIGTKDDTNEPTAVLLQQENQMYAIEIAAGYEHTCFILIDGKVLCMGDNQYGQLGNGQTADRNVPVEVVDIPESVIPKKVALGAYNSCFSTTSNQIYCWGRNDYGQIGNGNKITQTRLTLVQSIDWPAPPQTTSPTPAPNSITHVPTITKAGEDEWFIDNTGEATGEITSSDTILISFPFNATNKDIGALVFEEDCITPFDNYNYFMANTTSKTSIQPDGFVQFNTTLEMNVTAINGTKYWNAFTDGTGGGWVEICVETYLIFTDNRDRDNDDIVQKVDLKNNVLNISLSLNGNFDVGEVDLVFQEAVSFSVRMDYSELIVAYECDAVDPYVEAAGKTYEQGDEITICVADGDDGIVQVEEFVDLVVAQDGKTPYFFILGTQYSPDITTPVCLEATALERRVCYVKIRALSRFFQSQSPIDLVIFGSVYITRDGRRVRRNLRMVPPSVEKEEDEREQFKVKVSLGSAVDSAAPGHITGSKAAGLLSMAVGAALMV